MDGNDHVIPMMVHEGHDDEHVERYTDIRMAKKYLNHWQRFGTVTQDDFWEQNPKPTIWTKVPRLGLGILFQGFVGQILS